MAETYEQNNIDPLPKLRYGIDMFPERKIRRIPINTKLNRVCEIGKFVHETNRNCYQRAYRTIFIHGREHWGCDSCLQKMCEESIKNIMENQYFKVPKW